MDNYINNITKILNIHINNEDRFIPLLKYIKSEITRETTVLSYDFKSFDEFNMLDKKDILNLQNNFIKMIFKKIYNSLDKNHDLDDGLKIDIINTLSHGLNNRHGGGNHDGYGMAP